MNRREERAAVRVILCCVAVWAVSAVAWAADRGEDRFVKNTRQLTYEGRRSGECYFSPDGKKLVFMSERAEGNPFFQIYVLDFESGDVEMVSTGRGRATCPFFNSATGEIEFAATHSDPGCLIKQSEEYARRERGEDKRRAWDYDDQYDIFARQPDGRLKRLTYTLGYDAEGAYSPDGSKIVFCSLRDAYPPEKMSEEKQALFEKQPEYFGELYIMNADGSQQTRITRWPGYDGGPFFTPDGKRIVWRHFNKTGLIADIFTMLPDGTDRRQLTDFKAMSWAPFFHSSGEYCIFTTNKLGFDNFELFLVDSRGRHEPVRVTHTDRFDGLAVFSPDGKKMCWTSNKTETGKSQIFIGDWDHEAAMKALRASPRRMTREDRNREMMNPRGGK